MAVALKDAGSVEQRELVITGMTCASCVASVEDALRGVPGVRDADVNLATERARVERLARFVGPLRVEIAGPLGTDSLSKLLELVK